MRTAEHLTHFSFDGTRLQYRYWPAADSDSRQAIILFHRGHEHGGRIAHVVDELDLPDYHCFAWDTRGHGLSDGERGDSRAFEDYVRDTEHFVQAITRQHGIAMKNVVVIAQSVAAVYVSAWLLDFAPQIQAAVLAAPAFDVKLYVPFAQSLIAAKLKLQGNFFVNSYVKSRFLSHDTGRNAEFDADPLISKAISARILLGLYRTANRVIAQARDIRVPVQVLVAGADVVVKRRPQNEFFAKLSHPWKEKIVFPGFHHDVLGERDRQLPISNMRRFITETERQPAYVPDLRKADLLGASCSDYQMLRADFPQSVFSRWYWTGQREMLRWASRWSDSLQTGFKHGFNSGEMLEYVYANQATSTNRFGHLIDQMHLQAVGWEGIRARKVHLRRVLHEYIHLVAAHRGKVRILDMAAGRGRYVFEAFEQNQDLIEQVVLQDFSEHNVAEGQKVIAERDWQDRVTFVHGDAFASPSPLQAEFGSFDIVIVSGLYELFAENQLLMDSLSSIQNLLTDHGYLIYTNQPWHPQLAYIARALVGLDGQSAWAMRCRSQLEMDQLVANIDLKKLEQRIDDMGIFTVSVAQKQTNNLAKNHAQSHTREQALNHVHQDIDDVVPVHEPDPLQD